MGTALNAVHTVLHVIRALWTRQIFRFVYVAVCFVLFYFQFFCLLLFKFQLD